AQLLGRAAQRRIEGVGDRVQLAGAYPGLGQAPLRRQFRQLPGRERHRSLAVLAPGEPLLLGGGGHLAIQDERDRRIVKDRVDTQYPHDLPIPQIDRANPRVRSVAWNAEAASTGPGSTRRWSTRSAACSRAVREVGGSRSG